VVNTQVAEATHPSFGLALARRWSGGNSKPASNKNKPAMAMGRMSFEFDLYVPPEAAEVAVEEIIAGGNKLTPANKLDTPLNPRHQGGSAAIRWPCATSPRRRGRH